MTTKSGTISASEPWTEANSPFEITANLTIGAGGDNIRVDVEPGVEIIVYDNVTITITNTSLFILGGTRQKPINLHGRERGLGAWAGFRFSDVAAGNATLFANHTHFSDAASLLYSAHANSLAMNVYFKNCWVRYCNWLYWQDSQSGGGVAGSRFGMVNSRIEDCGGGIRWKGTAGLNSPSLPIIGPGLGTVADPYLLTAETTNAKTLLQNVWFKNIENYAIDINQMPGITNKAVSFRRVHFLDCRKGAVNVTADATGFDFESCWWGSDSGPTESTNNPSGDGENITGADAANLDYTPFLRLGRYVVDPDSLRAYMSSVLSSSETLRGSGRIAELDEGQLVDALERSDQEIDSWYLDGQTRTDRLFSYNTRTNEKHDIDSCGGYVYTDYWPIVSISAATKKTGEPATYGTTLSEKLRGGYYSSDEDKRLGRVHVGTSFPYPNDGFRLTYDSGFKTVPQELEAASLRLAARDVLSALALPGEGDPYRSRAEGLEKEIENLRKAASRRRRVVT